MCMHDLVLNTKTKIGFTESDEWKLYTLLNTLQINNLIEKN